MCTQSICEYNVRVVVVLIRLFDEKKKWENREGDDKQTVPKWEDKDITGEGHANVILVYYIVIVMVHTIIIWKAFWHANLAGHRPKKPNKFVHISSINESRAILVR